MPAIFPFNLDGLTYSTIRRPKFSTEIQSHASGREVRLGYWTYPKYEWDLIFELLRDYPITSPVWGPITSELRLLEGFYLAHSGALTTFLFIDPDDNAVTGQILGTGDSVSTDFPLIRTYGDASYGVTITEPVGAISTTGHHIYLNGILQSSGYAVVGDPYAYYVRFLTAPASGIIVSADYSFYFLARFKEDSLEFEKFMHTRWAVRKLTLESTKNQ
jgi:uncharacterized protein (TIGR02217 family)